jgi:stage V sporulation protein R
VELIDQHTKRIMEGCKQRARAAGLTFDGESLEYIVTNRDLLELTPKMMIPTLYDYWVHDVEVLREKGRYELYPNNPYETVINTRPAISYYNDNNPDWLNVMIFYHVLGHIDFFQNNLYFRHTWDSDFTGQALSDKRMIASLRSEKGRWVDYVIEFARGIDNLVGYHQMLSDTFRTPETSRCERRDYYFDVFLQAERKVRLPEYMKEIERFNDCQRQHGGEGETVFFAELRRRYPEFESLYQKHLQERPGRRRDLLQHILDHSVFLHREENAWMKPLIQVVRHTSLFFQPQIRTKIMNEGWASYWHERLFLEDDRIRGHEVDFARVHAGVTSLPRVGLNPYALGMRLFQYIEQLADKGRYSLTYRSLNDVRARERYDANTGGGRDFMFHVRANFCDFTFIQSFVDQDFVTGNRLFVAGRRLNEKRQVWEIFVKSRQAEAYRQMLQESLYHPPWIEIQPRSDDGTLKLVHRFEGKPLVRDFVAGVLLGIEYLWGQAVELETSEVTEAPRTEEETPRGEIRWQRVRYRMAGRQLTRTVI